MNRKQLFKLDYIVINKKEPNQHMLFKQIYSIIYKKLYRNNLDVMDILK